MTCIFCIINAQGLRRNPPDISQIFSCVDHFFLEGHPFTDPAVEDDLGLFYIEGFEEKGLRLLFTPGGSLSEDITGNSPQNTHGNTSRIIDRRFALSLSEALALAENTLAANMALSAAKAINDEIFTIIKLLPGYQYSILPQKTDGRVVPFVSLLAVV